MDSLECVQVVNVYFETTDVQPTTPQYIELMVGTELREEFLVYGQRVKKAILEFGPGASQLPDEAFYLYTLGKAMLDRLPELLPVEHTYRVSAVQVMRGTDIGCRLQMLAEGTLKFDRPQLH